MSETTRRMFVGAAATAAAAVRLEALAIDGGPKTVTVPAEQHNAIAKWPKYGAEERTVVAELLENNRFYQEIPLLEDETKRYLKVDHAKAHCNGTSALMSMFFALDLEPGSEILVPSYTASATIVPMRFFGLVPVFVDIRPDTATFDVDHARRVLTKRTKALVVMHSWGLPCDMDAVQDFAREKGLLVLEDAAQSYGARFQGKQLGTLGTMGMYSYQLSKVLPAVEGGMGVYTTREQWERATAFGNYDLPASFGAASAYRKYHDTGFGPKFRIHPIAAAIARQQLKKLDANNKIVVSQTRQLNERLTALPGLSEQKRRKDTDRVHWSGNILFFDEARAGFPKEALVKALQAEGVRAAAAPYPEQHKFTLYREAKWWHHAPDVPDRLPGCEQVNKTAIRLPLFSAPADELMAQYAAAFEKVWAHREKLRA
ncbi:MAG: DegT/DnrJ/EryC1/StrS family aminotransferase [Bryobacterales bacterium]|nr:DegT/DnrJ/EryC1/StrS family aminotransferase [Bryobacterales bacterium]